MDSLWNYSHMNDTESHYEEDSIGSGIGLVPSGNKPLAEPILTQNSYHNMVSLGQCN